MTRVLRFQPSVLLVGEGGRRPSLHPCCLPHGARGSPPPVFCRCRGSRRGQAGARVGGMHSSALAQASPGRAGLPVRQRHDSATPPRAGTCEGTWAARPRAVFLPVTRLAGWPSALPANFFALPFPPHAAGRASAGGAGRDGVVRGGACRYGAGGGIQLPIRHTPLPSTRELSARRPLASPRRGRGAPPKAGGWPGGWPGDRGRTPPHLPATTPTPPALDDAVSP